ncbi:hypothetical protein PHYBOEH_000687 [Phytophthora boehmeriae]|uniref:HTH CENPB-type domain-containing protein n=1 Tax=Phytophthora boehmeriae TaxID=109152 RepID=A0A8T1WUG3_9STRA|nr:hypothetical protein PHYBOEH_000687 [Phytophthora boehmeriae]
MASCEELASSTSAALSCPTSSDLQVDMPSSTLALLTAPDLSSTSQTDAASVATTALHLERYASELLLWLGERQRESPTSLAADDALFFFETRHPELLDDLPLLFAWLALYLAQHESAASADTSAVANRAVQQLESNGDLTTLADELQLKSSLTLLFWKYEADRQLQTRAENVTDEDRQRTVFHEEKELLQWLLSHRQVPLTKQDVINHILEVYPVFAASKSAAALRVWTSRFLKRHLPPYAAAPAPTTPFNEDMSNADDVSVATPTSASTAEVELVQVEETHNDQPTLSNAVEITSASGDVTLQSSIHVDGDEVIGEAPPPRHCGKRRACPGGYVLFSNEFKLHALQKLDEGKSAAEVAEELGLKNPKRLAYWKSVRDKLVTSEKKRFRLSGGGRRSSCSFEDELLTWVSERHQHGEGLGYYDDIVHIVDD